MFCRTFVLKKPILLFYVAEVVGQCEGKGDVCSKVGRLIVKVWLVFARPLCRP